MMMPMTVRLGNTRGYAEHGWLESYHSFSFGSYYAPENRGFSKLRVINEDIVAPAQGFATHAHADMEIITYVLSGALSHRDSLGNGSTLHYGDVQRMTAGTGIEHSEFNASSTEPVHLLQIWIRPDRLGLVPSYEETSFTVEAKQGRWCLIGSPDGREGSVVIHQDVLLYAAIVAEATQTIVYTPHSPERAIWLQVATGTVCVNNTVLVAGDAVAMTDTTTPLTLQGINGAVGEVLLFDLPAVVS